MPIQTLDLHRVTGRTNFFLIKKKYQKISFEKKRDSPFLFENSSSIYTVYVFRKRKRGIIKYFDSPDFEFKKILDSLTKNIINREIVSFFREAPNFPFNQTK